MAVLITGIGELTTNDPELGRLTDAALVLDGAEVAWVGPASQAPDADERVDVEGRAVLPGWVDSHTHLVFAGDRTAEFEARMAGKPYTAGGIAITVGATREASDEQLAENLRRHVEEAARQGTTCLETKTGYGLTVADEAGAPGSPGRWPTRSRSSVRTWCRRAPTPSPMWTWCAARCSTPLRKACAGRTSSVRPAPSTRPSRRGC